MQKKKRKNSKIWKKIIENEKEEEEKKAKDIWNRKKLVIKIEKGIKPTILKKYRSLRQAAIAGSAAGSGT